MSSNIKWSWCILPGKILSWISVCYVIQDIASSINKMSATIMKNSQWDGFIFFFKAIIPWKDLDFPLVNFTREIGYLSDTTELTQTRKLLGKAILCSQSFYLTWPHKNGTIPYLEVENSHLCQAYHLIFCWSMWVIWHLANPTARRRWGILLWQREGACRPWAENCWPQENNTNCWSWYCSVSSLHE